MFHKQSQHESQHGWLKNGCVATGSEKKQRKTKQEVQSEAYQTLQKGLYSSEAAFLNSRELSAVTDFSSLDNW